jgi:tetratricopeptide (TPR) repeat protein
VNKEELISLIQYPEKLLAAHVEPLQKILVDFPYFQTAHLLLAKALHNQGHYSFNKQLEIAALAVPDRTVLYTFIHNKTSIPVAPQDADLPPVDKPSEPVQVEMNEQPEAASTPQPEELEVILAENKTENTLAEKGSFIPDTAEQIQEKIVIPVVETTSEVHSLLEWLNTDASLPTPIEPENNPEPSAETVAENKAQPVEKTQLREEIAQQVERSNVNAFESVLDKFIRENPRISRPKAEFYNPVNMAKQSVEEDDELVTETLANVYYKQGHYKKAIRAYEKLCLIYPHKMSYFAGLIHQIKTENKD